MTTTYEYDAQSRVVTETGPVVASRITSPPDGTTHRARTTTTYTPNGEVDRATVSDVVTGESRWIDYSYDAAGREVGTLDNAGRQTTTTFDPNGNVATETGPDGATLSYRYTRRNQLDRVTAEDVVDDPIGAPGTKRDAILSTSLYDAAGRRYVDIDANGVAVTHRYRSDGRLWDSAALQFKDADPTTGLPGTGPARTVLVASTQLDAVGNPVRAFSPTDISYVEGFDGSAMAPGWQTTGAWSVSGGELRASQPGMAWRPGAADGQISLTVGATASLSVAFRVRDASNYLRLIVQGTAVFAQQVVDGVAQHILGNSLGTALAPGHRLEVSFAGNRLLVRRNAAVVMDTILPIDTADSGVGVLATAAGQGTDRFRFDAYERTDNVFDAYGRMVASTRDPSGVHDRTEWSLLPDGRPESVRHVDATYPQVAEQTRMGYDPATGQVAWSEELVADPNPSGAGDEVWARTSFSYDQRGLRTGVVAPEGGTVNYEYDEADDLIRVIGEPRTIERSGQAARPDVRPTETYGYNAFGELTHTQDALGQLTTNQIDARGFVVATSLPTYTPPGGTPIPRSASTEYDVTGRVTSSTDETGATTRFTYNTLGLQVAQQDPAVGGGDPGTWRFTYDDLGQMVEQRDPTGAVTRQRWDQLGRVSAVEEIVRQPQLASNVAVSAYGDGGSLVRSRTAAGVVTTAEYDITGRLVRSLDADGNATTHSYDGLGRLERVTDPDGRATRTVYDLAGDVLAEQVYGPGGTPLLGESRYTWDRDGRMLTAASPEGMASGYATSFQYDAAGQLIRTTEPVSATETITETVGYDEFGGSTRYTDGRGNTTWLTYNVMGLLEDNLEPAAGPHTAEADRRWRTSYDAAGQPVTETAPGGITVTSRHDALGRLVEQTGSGARATTATRTFVYDSVDRVTRASTPSAAQTFSYDDRGLLLSSDGGSGNSTFEYDADGRLTRQVDNAGQMDFAYDQRGLVRSMTSSLAGNVTYSYDQAGRPTQASYGNGTTRTYTYDAWGRVDTDRLTTGASLLYGLDYDHDRNGNVTGKTTSGPGVPSAGANIYTYDRSSRITGWTDPAGATETYAWDQAGNRTRSGATTAIFDAQNRLVRTEGPNRLTTNAWSADGTLQTQQVQRRITMVVANPAQLTPAESVLGFVFALGGVVVTMVDDNSAAPAVGSSGVIVISPDVDPAALGTKYRDLAVPVVTLDADTWQAMGLTTAAPTNTTGSSAHVVNPNHPVAAGKTGQVTWLGSAQVLSTVPNASLGSGAGVVWTEAAGSTSALVATYEAGAAAPGGAAPARRVALGLSGAAVSNLATDGWAVLAAAIGWAENIPTSLGTTTFDFDAFEQLKQIRTPGGETVAHDYDALDRRITSPDGSLTYAGMDIRPAADGAHRYQRGPLGVIAIDDLTQGDAAWALADGHTDVVGVFDAGDPALDGAQAFSPWGLGLGASGEEIPLGFQSERQDLPDGLIGMGVREYDPETGTFISSDPVMDAQVANGYGYSPSNPLGYVDPTGTRSLWDRFTGAVRRAAGAARSLARGARNAFRRASQGARRAASGFARAYRAGARQWARAASAAATRVARAARAAARGAVRAARAAVRRVASGAKRAVRATARAVSGAARKAAQMARAAGGEAARLARAAAGRASAAAKVARRAAGSAGRVLAGAARWALTDSPMGRAVRAVGSGVANHASRFLRTAGQAIDTARSGIARAGSAVVGVVSEPLRVVPEFVLRTAGDFGSAGAGFAGDVWDASGGAAIGAVSSCMNDLGGCAENAIKTAAAGVAGSLATSGCLLATGGAAAPACVTLGFTVGGAVHSALECPAGRAIVTCAAEGGVRGAASGVGFVTCGFFCAGAAGTAAAQAQGGGGFNGAQIVGAGLLSSGSAAAARSSAGLARRLPTRTRSTEPPPSRPSVPYNRSHYGGSATNSPAGQAARLAGEGQPCPGCTRPQVSGTQTAPWPQHEPPLVRHYYEEGGWPMTREQARAYARSDAAIDGTLCATCQRAEGGVLSQYSKEMKKQLGLE